jgi:hypothetical protein
MRRVDGEVTQWRRIDGVQAPVVAPVGGGGDGEALQHHGAEIKVRLGRNEEKAAGGGDVSSQF